MDETALAVLAAIAAVDLEPVKRRLMGDNNWQETRADRAIRQYRHFLFLCWKYRDGNTPNLDVDAVWHAHILHTRQYADDCMRIFGHFLHHDPGDGTQQDQAQHAFWYDRTKQRIVAEFGPAHAW